MLRDKSQSDGYQSYEDVRFFKQLNNFSYKNFTSDVKLRACNEKVSLLTVVLMYSNSLPAQDKDMAEIKTMIESIIEMIYSEMSLCTSNNDDLKSKVADVLVEQFNRLVENYNAHLSILKCGQFSESVIDTIKRTLWNFFDKRDLEDYREKMMPIIED